MTNLKIIATAEALNETEELTTGINVHQHKMVSDEPVEFGGKDLGPSPVDYLCAALASCKVINTFFCILSVSGSLNDEQLKRLLEISKACPVQRMLAKQMDVETVMA